jgi:copper chaperone CopZ
MTTSKVTMKILGMHCQSCVLRTERALKKVNGVVHVEVSLPLDQVVVEYQTELSTEEHLKQAVRAIGFQVPV